MYDPKDLTRGDEGQARAYMDEQKENHIKALIVAGLCLIVGVVLVLAQIPAIGLVVVAMGLIGIGYCYPTFGAILLALVLIGIAITGMGGSYEGGWR